MPTSDFLVARLAVTRADLKDVLDHLTEDCLRWKPAPGMHSVGDLLCEIARKDMEIIGWLRNGEWPDDEPDPFDPETATLAEMKAGLDHTRIQTLNYINQQTDEQLEELITLPERWWEALRLLECPKSEMIRNISAHEWYHTGQLITYLWSQGQNPNEW